MAALENKCGVSSQGLSTAPSSALPAAAFAWSGQVSRQSRLGLAHAALAGTNPVCSRCTWPRMVAAPPEWGAFYPLPQVSHVSLRRLRISGDTLPLPCLIGMAGCPGCRAGLHSTAFRYAQSGAVSEHSSAGRAHVASRITVVGLPGNRLYTRVCQFHGL
jgi:hypothetical protein